MPRVLLLISSNTRARNSLCCCDRKETYRQAPFHEEIRGSPTNQRPTTKGQKEFGPETCLLDAFPRSCPPPREGVPLNWQVREERTWMQPGGLPGSGGCRGGVPSVPPTLTGSSFPSSFTAPFPAGGAVTTLRQRGELPREAMALQEMTVQVSTTCCFPEPRGQRPGRSTMAFSS